MFKNSVVALVTPMHADGTFAKKPFLDLIEWHIASQTNAIVVIGNAGEAMTLTNAAEREEIITTAVKHAAGRIPIIAGTGMSSTAQTLELTLQAKKAGAAAALVVTPSHNRPTQHGLYLHYKTIAENAALPIILYDAPERAGCKLLPETVARLAALPNIIGIKMGTDNLAPARDIATRCNHEFPIYSSEDGSAMEGMLAGVLQGVISVTANIAPDIMHQMCEAALSKNRVVAEKLNAKLQLLHTHLFVEPSPIPVKWALHQMGLIPSGIRLPLTPLDNKFHADVIAAIRAAEIVLA